MKFSNSSVYNLIFHSDSRTISQMYNVQYWDINNLNRNTIAEFNFSTMHQKMLCIEELQNSMVNVIFICKSVSENILKL